jgi:hypothetical protein
MMIRFLTENRPLSDSFENDILSKGNSIVSALSSVGGLIALFLDLSDDKWDDCLVINY